MVDTFLESQDFMNYSGDDLVINVSVTTPVGIVVDISDVTTITWEVAKKVSSTPIIIKSLGDGIEIIDGPGGILTITLDAADTFFKKGDYLHELQIIDVNEKVSTVMRGAFTIEEDIVDDLFLLNGGFQNLNLFGGATVSVV